MSREDKNVPVMVIVRGDRTINEIKVVNALNIAEHELRLATEKEILEIGSVEGFVGPIGVKDVVILVDEEASKMKNVVVGGSKKDTHIRNVNYGRDFEGQIGQFRNAEEGDICPVCGKKLSLERGIEVGQIFKLGTKYSAPMHCEFQDDDGKVKPMVMGCYGIGVTRTMSSIIEQYHDEYGIKWPLNVAPYHAVVVPVSYQDECQKEAAENIYKQLMNNKVEVVLDDRNAKPGFKFKDWELIGIPYMIIVGRRANEGICELKNRETLQKQELTFEQAMKVIVDEVKSLS